MDRRNSTDGRVWLITGTSSGFGRSISETAVARGDTVGATREAVDNMNGTQPGDPAKAAEAIITALDAEETPLRLPLGADAVDGIRTKLDSVGAEIDAWEDVARSTAIEEKSQ